MLFAVRLPVLVPGSSNFQGLGPEPLLVRGSSNESFDQKRIIRVLVVDDVSSNMKLLARSLERYFNIWKSAKSTCNWKFVVTTAGDGHLAVSVALGVSSDLVLANLDAGALPDSTYIRSMFLLINICIYAF